jgi:hypothetical protein
LSVVLVLSRSVVVPLEISPHPWMSIWDLYSNFHSTGQDGCSWSFIFTPGWIAPLSRLLGLIFIRGSVVVFHWFTNISFPMGLHSWFPLFRGSPWFLASRMNLASPVCEFVSELCVSSRFGIWLVAKNVSRFYSVRQSPLEILSVYF